MPIPQSNPAARLRARQLGFDPDEVDLVETAPPPEPTKPVAPPPTLQEPSVLGKLWQAVNKPAINFDPEFIRKTSLLNLLPLPEAVKKGGSEAGAELVSGLTSPLGVGSLAAAPFFPATAAGVFGVLGAKGAYEAGKQGIADIKSGAGTEALTKDAVMGVASLLQMLPGGLMLKGKLGTKPTPPVIPPPEVIPESRRLYSPYAKQPEFSESTLGIIPDSFKLGFVPERPLLPPIPGRPMPEVTESTLGIKSGQKQLPGLGESGATRLTPEGVAALVKESAPIELPKAEIPKPYEQSTQLDLQPVLTKGTILIKQGITEFPEWSNQMVKQFGKEIIPNLSDTYREAIKVAEPIETSKTILAKAELPEGKPQFINRAGNVVSQEEAIRNYKEVQERLGQEPREPAGSGTIPPRLPTQEIPSTSRSRLPWSIAEIDRIERLGTPEAKTAAKGLEAFFDRQETLRGKFVNDIQNTVRKLAGLNNLPKSSVTNPLEYMRQNTPAMKNAVDWFFAKQDGAPLPNLSPEAAAIIDAVRSYYRMGRNEHIARPQIAQHLGPANPDYLSNIPKASVLKVITQKRGTPEWDTLANDFINYQVATGKASNLQGGQRLLNDYLANLTRESENRAAKYGPIDEPSGVGLPPSWRETNLLNILHRYGERVASRFAWHDTIEFNQPIKDALIFHGPNDSVKSVMRQIGGSELRDHPIINGLAGVAKASVMQFLSGVRDFVSAPFVGMRYHENPIQAGKNFAKSFAHMRQNIADAWATGRIRHNQSSLEIDLGMDDIAPYLRRTRDILSDASSRNWQDRMARSTLMGQGKFTTIDFHSDYVNGRLTPQGKLWFENFAKGVNWQQPNLTSEQIRTIASRYVDKAQSTYDPRGIPKSLYEGTTGTYFSLMRWGIEQANNFVKHSVQPAIQDHNFKPLLNDTVAGILGGSTVLFLNSLISGKKQRTPTIREVTAELSPEALAYWATGLADAAGNIGSIGSALKAIMDITYGKNKPQEIDNILISTGANLVENIVALGEAGMKEGVTTRLVLEFIHNVLNDTLQNYRLIANHIDTEKTDLANKKRDLRMFETLTEKDPSDQRQSFGTSFKEAELKDFRKTKNLQEAAELLPQLIDKAKAAADGDIEKFVKEMDKLKANSYNTMPNPESSPLREKGAFTQYYNFLIKTQGKEEADRRIRDWAEHQLKNQIKTAPLKGD